MADNAGATPVENAVPAQAPTEQAPAAPPVEAVPTAPPAGDKPVGESGAPTGEGAATAPPAEGAPTEGVSIEECDPVAYLIVGVDGGSCSIYGLDDRMYCADVPEDPIKKQIEIMKTMPVRQYLETTVVPLLLEGLQKLVLDRPCDPVEYLVAHLAQNKDRAINFSLPPPPPVVVTASTDNHQ